MCIGPVAGEAECSVFGREVSGVRFCVFSSRDVSSNFMGVENVRESVLVRASSGGF